jgi:DNA-binding NarL/FixJ family response regulator
MKTIKILFAEDHEMVRNGIKLMLASQRSFIADIDEASDGVEAILKATSNKYDVILLDINLPYKDGINVSKILHSKLERPRIIALTMHKEDYIIKEMINAGVLGYILKSSGLEELVKAILTVYDYNRYYSNEVSQIIIDTTLKGTEKTSVEKHAYLSKADFDLTKRELQILRFIAGGSTDKEIAEIFQISSRTVGNHRHKLVHKLRVKNSIELASFAVKNGLV